MKLELVIKNSPIIAAVRNVDDVDLAIKSDCEVIFLMTGNIINLKYCVDKVHQHKKIVFLHIDLLKGIARDKYGIEYIINNIQPDGIVSTKPQLISEIAKYSGVIAVDHIFLMDTQALKSGIERVNSSKSHFVEIMPGLMPRAIKDFSDKTKKPIIVAGLVHNIEEVRANIKAGACAVASSEKSLWNYKGIL